MPRRENDFQGALVQRIKELLPGAFVLKNDSSYLQGIPDLTILYGERWAILEVKRARPRSSRDYEPNQEWYLELFNQMSFSATIFPENEEEVLHDLQLALRPRRTARVS